MNRFLAISGAAALAVTLGTGWLRAEDAPKPADPPTQKPLNELTIEDLIRARGGSGSSNSPDPKKYRDFKELVDGAEKIDGLFTLYKKDDHLYAEIKQNQFDQPLLLPTTIARGIAQAGVPVGDDEMVLVFHKAGDKVQLVRRNIRYTAPANSPLGKSVKQNYTDSILLALPIQSVNPSGGMSTVIDFSDIFLNDFAQLGLGSLDRSRTRWHSVKGFNDNLELEVEATFGGGGRGGFRGNDGVPDSRGITLVVHYSLMKTPNGLYKPRVADDRVGHFLNATKDFSIDSQDTNVVRYINRWRLEKANPRAKLSPPKEQIIWYIEDTVPIEYRPYVEDGIREWNKAFEKIGFRDAIAVRWQEPGRDEFDPEDTNYCTFRWITSDRTYAMSCLRSNPLTGEMIDGDVVFDDSWVRHWKNEYALLVGSESDAKAQGDAPLKPLALGELISPILASKMGYGQPVAGGLLGMNALERQPGTLSPEVIPAQWGALQWQLSKRMDRGGRNYCQLHTGLKYDFNLAAVALSANAADDPRKKDEEAEKQDGESEKKDGEDKDDDKKDKPKPKKGELPEEFLGQAIKEVVMHEVGHSLGLRHNFKSSTMLKNDQLHDTAITREKGLVGSVMDYSPVNLAPKGVKQGDYYTTTLGPYDYWAIEYAYTVVDGNEEAELKKIAARAPEGDLVYATDEDAALNNDPYVNRYDLGADPCQFARERIALAKDLLKDLDETVVNDGESWVRTRRAFSTLLSQWGDGAHLASQYIAGQSVSRDHKGDKDARDPVIPVPGDKQRECLTFLVDEILSDKAFEFSPELLRRLGTERWYDWTGSTSEVDYPVLERILDIQRIALSHCLSADTLSRLQNQELQTDPDAKPLTIVRGLPLLDRRGLVRSVGRPG